jgi:hypothetical protein
VAEYRVTDAGVADQGRDDFDRVVPAGAGETGVVLDGEPEDKADYWSRYQAVEQPVGHVLHDPASAHPEERSAKHEDEIPPRGGGALRVRKALQEREERTGGASNEEGADGGAECPELTDHEGVLSGDDDTRNNLKN